jgi:hypothetical protein
VQRSLTEIEKTLIGVVKDQNTDEKTRRVAVNRLGEIEAIRQRVQLVKARKAVAAANKAAKEKENYHGL